MLIKWGYISCVRAQAHMHVDLTLIPCMHSITYSEPLDRSHDNNYSLFKNLS